MLLTEVKRSELVSKSKSKAKGIQRYKRRLKSRVKNTVKAMSSINMDDLFRLGEFTLIIPVEGETDDYSATIKYNGLLKLFQEEIRKTQTCTFREISRALIRAYNNDNVYVGCSCADFKYRFSFWSTKNNYSSIVPELRPADITNPDDQLGSSCKHVLLVLSNQSWILRAARVIMNYITYMKDRYPDLYSDVIYPALYGKEFEDDVQQTFIKPDDKDVAAAIDAAKTRGQFKKGNTQGVRFARNETPDDNQLNIDDDVSSVVT